MTQAPRNIGDLDQWPTPSRLVALQQISPGVTKPVLTSVSELSLMLAASGVLAERVNSTAAGIMKNSVAALNAIVAPAPGAKAEIRGSGSDATDGYYEKTGAAGAAGWTRRAGLDTATVTTLQTTVAGVDLRAPLGMTTVGGTADALTGNAPSRTGNPAASGNFFVVQIAINNTGAVTLDINATGPLPVNDFGGQPLVANDLRASRRYLIEGRSGLSYRVLSSLGNAPVRQSDVDAKANAGGVLATARNTLLKVSDALDAAVTSLGMSISGAIDTVRGATVSAGWNTLAKIEVLMTPVRDKVAGVEANADVTDYTNVSSALAGADVHGATPADTDGLLFSDSEDDGKAKRLLWSNLKVRLQAVFDPLYQPVSSVLTATTAAFTIAKNDKLSGIEAGADVTDLANVETAIASAVEHGATPEDADSFAMTDTEASNGLKRLTWLNMKNRLKSVFDPIYATANQGAKADSAVQPAALDEEATTRATNDTAIDQKAAAALARTAPLVDYPADASVRPGKNPALFTSTLTGRAASALPLSADDVVSTDYGEAIRKTGPFVVAPCDPRAILDDHSYRVTFIVSDDTPGGVAVDPQGDTMRLALRWLNGNYATIATRVVEDRPLSAADGYYVKSVVMSKLGTEGQGGLDIKIPPTARHWREFAESFSASRTRSVHVLSVEDTTSGVVLSGDVSALSSRLTSVENRSISVAGLAAGGGAISGNPTIAVPKASEAEVNAATDDTKAVTPKGLAYLWSVLGGKVPLTRIMNVAGLVKGGGGLNNDRTFEVTPATAADVIAATANDMAVTPLAIAGPVADIAAQKAVLSPATSGFRLRGAARWSAAIAIDAAGNLALAGMRVKASFGARAFAIADRRNWRVFSIARDGRRLRLGPLVVRSSTNPNVAFRVVDSRGNVGFLVARSGALRASGLSATATATAYTTDDAQPALGRDLFVGSQPIPVYVANLLRARDDVPRVRATIESYAAPGGEAYTRQGADMIVLDPARLSASAKLTLAPIGAASDTQVERPLTVRKPLVTTAAISILAIGDSITEAGMMDLVRVRLEAAGRIPTFRGTIRSGAYNASTSADEGGQLGEARSGRMLAHLTYRVADSDVQPVPAGDEAAYLGGSKPFRIGRNPFLKLDDGSKPARVQNGYFFSPAFYQARGFIPAAPDVVVFGLGTNDWRDITGPSLTTRMLADLAISIPALREDWPNAQILLWLAGLPRAPIRDAVWAEGPRRVQQALVKYVENLNDPKVKLVSTWAHMSPEIAYPASSVTNPDTGTSVTTLSDSIHPDGLNGIVRAQIADTIDYAIRHHF